MAKWGHESLIKFGHFWDFQKKTLFEFSRLKSKKDQRFQGSGLQPSLHILWNNHNKREQDCTDNSFKNKVGKVFIFLDTTKKAKYFCKSVKSCVSKKK